MRVPVVLWLSVAAAALTAPANADLPHDYGLLWNPTVPAGDADKGMQLNINTDYLIELDCGTPDLAHVSHEMWYGVVPHATYWVEVGFASGSTQSGCRYNFVLWADNRNGGGYHEHYPNVTWQGYTWYQALIAQPGADTCTWDVWLGNVYLGTSSANCPGTGRYLAGGIESTGNGPGPDQQVRGWMWNWQRFDSTRTWQSDWGSGAAFNMNSPPYIRWTDGSQTETEEVLNVGW